MLKVRIDFFSCLRNNDELLNESSSGQFHQYFMSAFASKFLCHKKFKPKLQVQKSFAQKFRTKFFCKNVGEIDTSTTVKGSMRLFLCERFARCFFVLEVKVKLFIGSRKLAHKMLVKLTPQRQSRSL